ncbi:MAG: glycosyltransferase family 4 protein [Endomicrobiales bacterium]|nr:glycosyltransferase family 4 protein [Endomicrobiales bacterium]
MLLTNDKLRVVYLRSTSIFNDSRATKEINTLIEYNCKLLVLGWDRDGFGTSKLSSLSEKNNFKIAYFKIRSNYGDGYKSLGKLILFQLWLLIRMLKNLNSFDIIHCCDFETALPSFLISKIFKKKLIYDIYDYYIHSRPVPKFLKRFIENLEIGIINNADTVIICNENRYEQMSKTKPKNIIVIHNTPEINFANDSISLNKQNNRFRIVYVGLLQNGRLLSEIGNLISVNPDIELHIGGYGKLSEYFKELSKKHNNIVFYGEMDYNSALLLEAKADVLFATYDPEIINHKYSAPNKFYEAMAFKKPIIVSRGIGIDKVVEEENIGIVIDYDAKSFFAAVQYLKNNPGKCIEMGKNGRLLYDKKYSWEIMKKRLLGIYK